MACPTHNPSEIWNEARVATLRRMWGDGATAQEIATQLGGGITRNAVVGKAHRLGLAGRPSPIHRDGVPRPRKPRVRRAALEPHERQTLSSLATPAAPPAPPPAPPPERVSNRTCAWPIGDPREPDFHFCGKTPVRGDRSYCDEHQARAFQKRAPHASAAEPAPTQRAGRAAF